MKTLLGHIILITGAASAAGIGFAAAKKAGTAGATVIITDLENNYTALEDRVAELASIGVPACAFTLDVTNSQEVDKTVQNIISKYSRLDAVFNNAGYAGGVGEFLEIEEREFTISWQVNVQGVINICKAVIPIMQRQGKGSIINNSSLAGIGVTENMSGYNTTKFAVVGLTKSLAAEFGKDNIRVNAICPGMVWTDMGRKEVEFMKEPGQTDSDVKSLLSAEVALQQRWAEASEIGDAVVYLASEQSSYITGVTLPIAGGLSPGL